MIYQALNVKDNNLLRSQAEAEIFQLFKENITDFFYVCATIVGDENKQVVPRQSTASVMKTLLARKVPPPLRRTTTASGSGTTSNPTPDPRSRTRSSRRSWPAT